MFQQTTIIGNLGKEPELRFTQNQKAVCKFSVAVKTGYGEHQKLKWFNVVTWGKVAESCDKYLTKGSKVLALGELEDRSWDKDDGTKGYATDLVAREVKFLSPKNSDQSQQPSFGEAPNPGMDPSLDDIPF